MKNIIVILAGVLLLHAVSFSQVDRVVTPKDLSVQTTLNDDGQIPELNSPDYKVIASNTSYIEIEFEPQFAPREFIRYNNQQLSIINFSNFSQDGPELAGHPDLRYRVFPIILPSENGNSVAVVDYNFNDVSNVDLAPIPGVSLLDPYKRNFENIILTYDKNSQAYSVNSFFPANIAELKNIGLTRDLTIGSLVVHPYQYNPVTRVLRQFTRIRIRLSFGESPVYNYRIRSSAEYSLLKDAAINANVTVNWISPKAKNQSSRLTNDSKLAQGDWYKIEIKDVGSNGSSEGIYKITRSTLEGAGISLANVDPATIKIYGNGGDFVPADINAARPEDLVEVRTYYENLGNGQFNLLFYGRAVNNWRYDESRHFFYHYLNFYTNSNYYWICLNTPGNGLRMNNVSSENAQNPYIPTSFTEKLFWEPEQVNLISEGTLWLSYPKHNGEGFSWSNILTGLEPNSNILYKIKPASRVLWPYSNHFEFREARSSMGLIYFPMQNVYGGFGDWIYTTEASFTLNASQKDPPNSENSEFQANFYAANSEGEGYLDWMEIQYKRRFNSPTGDFLRFSSPETTAVVEYQPSLFSSTPRIFDITEHNNVGIIQPLSSTSNSARFQKTSDGTQLSYFLAVGANGYKSVQSSWISQRVPNQNLRGFTDGADFIIITHPDLLPAANLLKQRRERGGPSNPDYLSTLVVTTYQIYNEFSGGLLDAVALRDYIKHAYDNWTRRPSYVLFFGDGDFDYTNILNQSPHANLVPAFEFTDPQINQVNGYVSDDFYSWISGNDLYPDIAHGRITARSLEQANGYLDKLDCYEDPAYNGYWKNRGIYVADDGKTSGGNDGSQHTDQAETLAESYTPQIYEKTKIYLVAYPSVITSQGRRKPDVNTDIIKYWNAGSFAIHYVGHGAPTVWAHEYVFEKDVAISQLRNQCKYNFVSVASCDFSKWDNPLAQSGGEDLVMTTNKGSIASLAASRPVYGGQNSAFCNKFYYELLFPRDTLRFQTRFGKAQFNTKLIYASVNDFKFILIGDPTARIQVPRFSSVIDSISGLSNDTMRALSRIKIYGSVIHPDSSLWSDYNGKIFLKIFDVPRNIRMFDEDGYEFRFVLAGGTIFSGTQNVQNGKWRVEFIVPKDISYLNQNGKIINYFYNSQADGHGLYTNFIIGGIDPNAPADSIGPDIKLFLNNRDFRSGDIVNPDFKFIADFFDESGINTTGSIGHKIEATLDGNVNQKYDLTTFYNSDTTYKSGSLEYEFLSITDGEHRLTLKAWDTYDNSSEAEIKFVVSSYNGLKVVNVYNYPNPFKDNTTFTFQHNYPEAINVRIKIYTVAGRLIKEIQQNDVNDKFVTINWPGKDEDGETLGNGIYIYKLTVQSGDGKSVTETGKLAVLK
jgi:hypothetical protein